MKKFVFSVGRLQIKPSGTGDENVLFPASLAHARYSSRMIDRFLNWNWGDDHGKRQDQRPLPAPA